MRTRSGSLYSNNGGEAAVGQKRKRTASPMGQSAVAGECAGGGRRKRLARGPDYLDVLPDDLVLSILSKLAASASAPSDLVSVHLTCKRLNELGGHDMVFAKASPASLAVKAAAWSEPAQRFLKRCADAGNLEACYILGMIRFYCLGSRSSGAALLARAAVGAHAAALYSLAVIQFNGSGGAKSDRDPPRGRGAVRARGRAGPRRRAPRARALPPGRLRRAARPPPRDADSWWPPTPASSPSRSPRPPPRATPSPRRSRSARRSRAPAGARSSRTSGGASPRRTPTRRTSSWWTGGPPAAPRRRPRRSPLQAATATARSSGCAPTSGAGGARPGGTSSGGAPCAAPPTTAPARARRWTGSAPTGRSAFPWTGGSPPTPARRPRSDAAARLPNG
ncbi:hypothetical protein PVAP13_5KG740001 [Panicum virgatum]|uniref:F-box protein n=1 Tax=Panicum virgatum TaxID=38727 RepID=A0A8T0SY17_PANVG|nr:hypothetical protein PVAP13_5KG740001 [Panicum virgatum]